jgi:hypothetical protein
MSNAAVGTTMNQIFGIGNRMHQELQRKAFLCCFEDVCDRPASRSEQLGGSNGEGAAAIRHKSR